MNRRLVMGHRLEKVAGTSQLKVILGEKGLAERLTTLI